MFWYFCRLHYLLLYKYMLSLTFNCLLSMPTPHHVKMTSLGRNFKTNLAMSLQNIQICQKCLLSLKIQLSPMLLSLLFLFISSLLGLHVIGEPKNMPENAYSTQKTLKVTLKIDLHRKHINRCCSLDIV